MQFLIEIFRVIIGTIGQMVTAIVGVIVLVVIGAVMIGFGAVNELEWLVYGGVVVAALGVIPIARVFFDAS